MNTVAILPNHMKLGFQPSRIALDDLIWPLGQPENLRGGRLGDLSRDDHLICFPRTTLHNRPGFGTQARVSVMVLEPEAIHGHHLARLRRSHRRFHRVLTCHEGLLRAIPNGLFFPFGGTWVPGWEILDCSKSRQCSLIASAKASETGHRLRHEMADWVAANGLDVDVMGGGYAPFGEKSEGLAPYRFSLIIENVQEPNYFTEKLIDAVLCETVPIYWGCPNIGDFMDPRALIICDGAPALQKALRRMSSEVYEAHLPTLRAMKRRAAFWGDVYTRAAETVLKGAPLSPP